MCAALGERHPERVPRRRLGPLLDVLLSGAKAGDPDLTAFADTIRQERLFRAADIVRQVVEAGGLRPGLDEERARDIVWTLNSPEGLPTADRRSRLERRGVRDMARAHTRHRVAGVTPNTAVLASGSSCLHNASMSNVLVRDLPDEVHERLAQKARASGQSLQQYLSDQLTRLASTPTMDEVLDRIATRTGGSVGFEQAANDLAAERERR